MSLDFGPQEFPILSPTDQVRLLSRTDSILLLVPRKTFTSLDSIIYRFFHSRVVEEVGSDGYGKITSGPPSRSPGSGRMRDLWGLEGVEEGREGEFWNLGSKTKR